MVMSGSMPETEARFDGKLARAGFVFVDGADLSDHWAYAETGVPAMMITDTAPYRNPFYHQPYNTPDTVDYASLARITGGIEQMTRALLSR